MKKLAIFISCLLLAFISLIFIQFTGKFQGHQSDDPIRITVKDLNSIHITEFISANTDLPVKTCTVSFEVGDEIKEFQVHSQTTHQEFKNFLTSIKPGETIMVQKRLAVVDGKEKKLPVVTYSVIE